MEFGLPLWCCLLILWIKQSGKSILVKNNHESCHKVTWHRQQCSFYCLFIISNRIMFSEQFGSPRMLKFFLFSFWRQSSAVNKEIFTIFTKIAQKFRWSTFHWLLNLTFLNSRDAPQLMVRVKSRMVIHYHCVKYWNLT